MMPKTKELTLHGQKITVREMRWMDARQFLNKLAAQAGAFFDVQESPETGINVKFVFDLPRLIGVIKDCGELADFLLTKSTGQPEAWLQEISLTDGLQVLDAALELNVSEEIITALKKTVAGMATAVRGRPTNAVPETPASATF
jgi:hypothetical protein